MPLKLGLSFGQSRTTEPKPRPAPTTAYHAVAIWPPRDACDAARAVKGERVLAQDAPLLPLERCDRAARCSCRYQHYEDRRAQPRRQADGAPPSAAAAASDVERRVSVGRRAEDRLELDFESADEPDDLADTYFGYHGKS